MSATYADLERLLAVFETRPVQPARLARLTGLLATATAQAIDEADGRDYFAHPGDGSDASWTVDGDGSGVLHAHYGIISLAAIEVSADRGVSYTPVEAGAWQLRGDSPWSSEPKPDAEPYFHLVLTGAGPSFFPASLASARLLGRRGWPAVPEALAEGVVERARQIAYADGSYSGSSAGGPDEYGSPPTTSMWPQAMFNFLRQQRERFMACYVGGGRAVAPWQ